MKAATQPSPSQGVCPSGAQKARWEFPCLTTGVVNCLFGSNRPLVEYRCVLLKIHITLEFISLGSMVVGEQKADSTAV